MKILPLIAIAITAILTGCGEKTDKAVSPYEELRDTERLCLAEMAVSKVGKISDRRLRDAGSVAEGIDAALNHLKIGDRIAVYSFDTYLSAYIDLRCLRPGDVTVDTKGKVCHVTLPPIEIETSGRDIRLNEEHYRVTGLRSQIRPEERAALKEQMSRAVAKEIEGDHALQEQLVATARAKARRFVTDLLSRHGYTADISFR
ncbi:MAG: DUF4230 domain-containing protein [Pseudoflavonifractor sp.]|nr:DUF4230 domain-containing protein [Pseudoflavonifractor sp.]